LGGLCEITRQCEISCVEDDDDLERSIDIALDLEHREAVAADSSVNFPRLR
jgi:hypothetical protein